jgi:putative hydrolase of the HAD superfamily
MNLTKYQAVIFDLFHTLTSLETTKAPGRSTSEILGVSRDEWNKQQSLHADALLRSREMDAFQTIKKLALAIRPNIPDEIIREATENRLNKFRHALLHPDPESLDALARLKALKKLTGLVSNVFPMDVLGWNDSPLKPYFDSKVFSCDIGFAKPEPEIYEFCLDSLAVKPAQALYIGDGGSDELKGAREVGMTTVLMTRIRQQLWPDTLPGFRKYADFEIESLKELFD